MKRLCLLCLTLGMLCGAAATAGAVEIKAKGTWEILSEWSNVAPLNGPNDRFATLQRLRTQVEIISSNALKGVVFFEIGDTNWGKASEGGALGTDAKNIEVRYSYVDWQVPNTDLRVRMGLQPIILPGFVASGFSPVFGHDENILALQGFPCRQRIGDFNGHGGTSRLGLAVHWGVRAR